jgi:hypothetical protein
MLIITFNSGGIQFYPVSQFIVIQNNPGWKIVYIRGQKI